MAPRQLQEALKRKFRPLISGQGGSESDKRLGPVMLHGFYRKHCAYIPTFDMS